MVLTNNKLIINQGLTGGSALPPVGVNEVLYGDPSGHITSDPYFYRNLVQNFVGINTQTQAFYERFRVNGESYYDGALFVGSPYNYVGPVAGNLAVTAYQGGVTFNTNGNSGGFFDFATIPAGQGTPYSRLHIADDGTVTSGGGSFRISPNGATTVTGAYPVYGGFGGSFEANYIGVTTGINTLGSVVFGSGFSEIHGDGGAAYAIYYNAVGGHKMYGSQFLVGRLSDSHAFFQVDTVAGLVQLFDLPTSALGLPANTIWNNGGVLNIT
ncbi:MAG: hypothetical protein JST26_04905 [Bacteroidetes bacterium]|nr:hypothetical protein [Bacteroidota bacterium]